MANYKPTKIFLIILLKLHVFFFFARHYIIQYNGCTIIIIITGLTIILYLKPMDRPS